MQQLSLIPEIPTDTRSAGGSGPSASAPKGESFGSVVKQLGTNTGNTGTSPNEAAATSTPGMETSKPTGKGFQGQSLAALSQTVKQALPFELNEFDDLSSELNGLLAGLGVSNLSELEELVDPALLEGFAGFLPSDIALLQKDLTLSPELQQALMMPDESGFAAPLGVALEQNLQQVLKAQANQSGGANATPADLRTLAQQLSPAGVSEFSNQSDLQFRQFISQAAEAQGLSLDTDGIDSVNAKLIEGAKAANQAELKTSTLANRPYSLSVNTMVGDGAWGQELGQKIVWMSGRGIQSAQINLNPVELGPVEVKVSVQNEQTVVTFQAQQGATREALEASVPKLREMLEEAGVQLADVDVGNFSDQQEQLANQDGGNTSGGSNGGSDSGEGEDASGLESVQTGVSGLSLVDTYI